MARCTSAVALLALHGQHVPGQILSFGSRTQVRTWFCAAVQSKKLCVQTLQAHQQVHVRVAVTVLAPTLHALQAYQVACIPSPHPDSGCNFATAAVPGYVPSFTNISNSIYSNGLGTGWSVGSASSSIAIALQQAGAGLQGSNGLCVKLNETASQVESVS